MKAKSKKEIEKIEYAKKWIRTRTLDEYNEIYESDWEFERWRKFLRKYPDVQQQVNDRLNALRKEDSLDAAVQGLSADDIIESV